MSLRKELGELLDSELPLLDSLIGPTILQQVKEILDRHCPPICEACELRIPQRELAEWRGPEWNSPWWSAPRMCQDCFERHPDHHM